MFFWNSLAFSLIQQMLAIWSLVPLPFLKPAWTSGKFTVHKLLRPGLENFEHYFTSVWDECNCASEECKWKPQGTIIYPPEWLQLKSLNIVWVCEVTRTLMCLMIRVQQLSEIIWHFFKNKVQHIPTLWPIFPLLTINQNKWKCMGTHTRHYLK